MCGSRSASSTSTTSWPTSIRRSRRAGRWREPRDNARGTPLRSAPPAQETQAMAILLPTDHPGADFLRKEGVTVLSEGACDPNRVLRLGLVNLMPRKEATELAFARLLAQSAHA